ncbi:12719_t:CDS:2 [Funneliformis geosporum]|uniref:12719_t:CDS:1 n=1 Tax=Funneliformis geosporum TaxID=1117311 RepID=A0A9W4SAF8_9GLOM|nr:12719_t:CDS:2 [Funneliformis geosporum]
MSRIEEFLEDDLYEFEDLIVSWSYEFVDIFARFNPIWRQLETIHPLQLEGMENLLTSLDTFLDNTTITSFDDDDSFIWLYKSATLQSIDIIYASFYNNASQFSDVTIVMDTEETVNYITD